MVLPSGEKQHTPISAVVVCFCVLPSSSCSSLSGNKPSHSSISSHLPAAFFRAEYRLKVGIPVTAEVRTFFLLVGACSCLLDVNTNASADEVMNAGA